MAHELSAWRASDAVRFEAARDSADTSTALVFDLADSGRLTLAEAVHEARAIRLDLLSIDGFERDAIDGFIERLEGRIAALKALQA